MCRGRLVLLAAVVACGGDDPKGRITGSVWSDDNGNGVHDPDEAGIPDVLVYADVDSDPTIGALDPVARTAADGSYELVVPGPGTYPVREVLPFGLRPRTPAQKPTGPAHIIGGSDTVDDEYGFMVGLVFRSGTFVFQFCGGALITDRHIVTAAHCSVGIPLGEVAILAGTRDPFNDDGKGLILDVQRIETHPTFNFDAGHGYDIAIWTLKEPIDLEATGLHTVEMITEDTLALAETGTLATTIGWGVTERETSLLQQVHVPVVSEEECQTAYPTATNLDTQLCAGVPEGGIDSCQGDSGSPLLVRDDAREVWLLAGITSYGEGCALPTFPGVYSRVSALSSWAIEHATDTSDAVMAFVETVETPGIADFPTQIATRPQVGAIEPRWQLAGFTLPGAVLADSPLTVDWRILGDPGAPTAFTCSFQPDLLAGTPAEPVACALGDNEATLAGFPTGIFATALLVESGGLSFTRRVDVFAGVPTATTTVAALEAQDPLDPDFSDPLHLDYYTVGSLSGTKAFAVEVRATGPFTAKLTLYDANQRDLGSGGGFLEFGATTDDGYERIVVVPEAGTSYLIGVSSREQAAIGQYEVRIINDGVLTPL